MKRKGKHGVFHKKQKSKIGWRREMNVKEDSVWKGLLGVDWSVTWLVELIQTESRRAKLVGPVD